MPLYANQSFLNYTGLSFEQARDGGWLSVQHPDDAPRVAAAWHNAAENNAEYALEARFCEAASGDYRWFRIKGSPVRDNSGQTIYWVVTCTDIHDVMLAQEALRSNEQRLRLAMEIGHIGCFERDLLTNTVTWDEQAQVIMGLPETAPSPSAVWNIIHPDDRAMLKTAMDESLDPETRTPYSLEFRTVRPDGQMRWMAALGRVFFDDSFTPPKPLRRFGVIQDITESRRFLEALRQSEEHFKAIVSSTPDHILVQDRELRYSFVVNPQLGLTEQDMLGKTDYDILTIEDADNPPAIKKQVLEIGTSVHLERSFISKEGKQVFFEGSFIPKFDARGQTDGLIGYFRNVTERQQAEKALRESEQLYRAIGESIDYGVWTCAPDGRNTYASKSFLDMVGLTQQECADFGWGDVLHPDDAEHTIAAWQECVRTGETWDIEHRFRGVDGQWHPVLARGVPIRDEQGNITTWAGINLDISRLKETEEALLRSNQRFELLAETASRLLAAEQPQQIVEDLCRKVMALS